jgi:CRISPR/Cas system CSM-associated protein Csm4 (group 5 of RAMP superfamily)
MAVSGTHLFVTDSSTRTVSADTTSGALVNSSLVTGGSEITGGPTWR